MSSSGKSPNVFGIPATLQWCVGSIEQLKGQVWGLITTGGSIVPFQDWVNSQKNIPNGIAGLDASAKIDPQQLPFVTLTFRGTWNAENPPVGGVPDLLTDTPNNGDFFIVSEPGGQDLNGTGSVDYYLGDIVVFNDASGEWQRVEGFIPTAQVVDTLADANYTLKAKDNQKLLKAAFTTLRTITVPTDTAEPALAVGSRVDIMMNGTVAGQASFVGPGVTIRSKGGTKTNGQYTVVSIEKIAANEWVLVGDLTS
jgi:hypothetical protein